ncbi:MAG: sugar-binding domain-containing protein, partial [Lapillicoccus sp.]
MTMDGTAAALDDARATAQDGTYPRPQMMRRTWTDLSGPWDFCFDDQDLGLAARWYRKPRFSASIIVPFPPESPASKIHDTTHHTLAWYHRDLALADLTRAGYGTSGSRLLLHFGAVDYRCRVWLNATLLGEHEGGHTPFSFDVTDALDLALDAQSLVVRVEDDPLDLAKPRGKQDWQTDPHAIWYHRTTGIWQPVWLEAVPDVAIESVHWVPDVPASSVSVAVRLSARPPRNTSLTISLSFDGVGLGTVSFPVGSDRLDAVVPLSAQRNGQAYEEMLWSPEHPRLLDAVVALRAGGEAPVVMDTVHSYVGLRSAAVERGAFLLNDRPYYVRSVLSQGYWPQSHLASPSAEALREEVQLIKDLGFNAARVHQKIEDPR